MKAAKVLQEFSVAYDAKAMSAHRTARRMEWATMPKRTA
jgi:phosphoribosylcarboxyaminoimidazole (NCAIR) mutase